MKTIKEWFLFWWRYYTNRKMRQQIDYEAWYKIHEETFDRMLRQQRLNIHLPFLQDKEKLK